MWEGKEKEGYSQARIFVLARSRHPEMDLTDAVMRTQFAKQLSVAMTQPEAKLAAMPDEKIAGLVRAR